MSRRRNDSQRLFNLDEGPDELQDMRPKCPDTTSASPVGAVIFLIFDFPLDKCSHYVLLMAGFKQEAINSVELERALETQRLALLRLLAGMAFVVAFVSNAPAVSMLPQWVRSSIAALLPRVEAAAECLVIVAARVFCGQRIEPSLAVGLLVRDEFAHDQDIPAVCLLRRIAVLCAALRDLPRQAKRLIKRLTRSENQEQTETPVLEVISSPPKALLFLVARIERPPDKTALEPRVYA